jgi:hypothetical protein
VTIIFLNTTERHGMNDEDLRDLIAGLSLIGFVTNVRDQQHTARWCYEMADAMIEAKYYEEPKEPEEGITAIKPKRKVK